MATVRHTEINTKEEDEFNTFNTQLEDVEQSQGVEINLNVNINNERDEVERRKLFPPTGDYLKGEDWTVKSHIDVEDRMKDDTYPTGRVYLSCTGPAENVKTGDVQYFFFRCSPDPRDGKDERSRGRADIYYQNWHRAKDLYFSLHNEFPQVLEHVAEMFRVESFTLMVKTNNKGAFINGFRVKGQRR
jgi:hypothetical protein